LRRYRIHKGGDDGRVEAVVAFDVQRESTCACGMAVKPGTAVDRL
jgi:hypothetical protein